MSETNGGRGVIARAERATWLHWLAVGLATAIGTINVGLGLAVGDGAFVLVGAVFYLGVALYFTRYWRAVLYVLAAIHTLALGVLWVLAGMQYPTVGALTGVVSLAFVAVVLVLFVREGAAGTRAT